MLYLTEKENYDLSVINFQSESGFYFFSAPFRGDGREVRRGRLCPEEKSLMRSVWENIYIYVKRIQEIWRCEGKNVFLHNT